jgi:hypothetical protein
LGQGRHPEKKDTVWQNISRESPGSRRVLIDSKPTIWEVVEVLKPKGLYFAERRED